MPTWLYNALTVLPPIAALLVATVGAIAFVVMLASKKVWVKYAAAGIYALGAFGFANLIVGVLY